MFALHVVGRISHYNQEMLPSHPRSTDQLYRLSHSPRLLLSLRGAQRGSEVIEDDIPVPVFVAPSNPTQFRSQFQDVFHYDGCTHVSVSYNGPPCYQYISLKALPRTAQSREDQAGRQNRETAPQAQRAPVEAAGASWVCTYCRPA